MNINPNAVHKLLINKAGVEFDARFSGASRHVFVPMAAVKAIYAKENGAGMAFPDEDFTETGDDDGGDSGSQAPSGGQGPGKKSHLKVVK